MNRFIGVLVVRCVLIAGVGYYRGWFHAEAHNAGGEDAITVTVDKDKLNHDTAAVRQEAHNLSTQASK